MNRKKLLWKIAVLAALLVVAAGVIVVYFFVLKPKPGEGMRTVSLSVIAEKDGKADFVRSYEIRTDYTYLRGLLAAVNDECGFGISDAELESGYITSAFGYASDFSDHNEFYSIYTSDSRQSDASQFSYKLNGEKLGSATRGTKELELADGETYLIALVSDVLPLERTIGDEPVKIEISDPGALDEREKQATQTLVTVLVIVGAAFASIVGLTVIEAVKAKKLS